MSAGSGVHGHHFDDFTLGTHHYGLGDGSGISPVTGKPFGFGFSVVEC